MVARLAVLPGPRFFSIAVRRRVRMCYWKQWRYVRTKVCNLFALGTFKRQAILTALSSKSYWRLSRAGDTVRDDE